jgi:hypothetical protein
MVAPSVTKPLLFIFHFVRAGAGADLAEDRAMADAERRRVALSDCFGAERRWPVAAIAQVVT